MLTIKSICYVCVFIVIGFGTLYLSSAHANSVNCTKRIELLKELKGKFSEKRHGFGILAGNQGVMELYVSKEGTWTMFATFPNGAACIIAVGHSMETIPIVFGPDA